jgi:hypothetical protein
MSDNTLSIGLVLTRESRFGTEYVDVKVMGRNGGNPYPRGLTYPHSDKPDCYDNLMIRGFLTDRKDVIADNFPEYYDIYNIDVYKVRAMVRTLERCRQRIVKDSAWDHGDKLVSFAKAIGAQWAMTPAGREHRVTGGMWSNTHWVELTIPAARNLYREIIADMTREAMEKESAA